MIQNNLSARPLEHASYPANILWMMAALLSIIWLGSLGFRHLIPSDEGRYAEIAREMLVSGNWLVPKYNGYLYFEKPPLQMWITALTFKLFGLGEWQARLWSGLTSLAGIFFFAFTAGKIWGARVGQLTAIILASSPIWILGGHFNSLDMGIAFFMGSSLCCLLLSWHYPYASKNHQIWMMLCWVSMALAVMSKGLIGIVLPGFVLVIYSLTSGDWKSWQKMLWIKGLSIFFLVSAPWFIYMSYTQPEFVYFFFIHEHFERFTTNEHLRSAPWYYFITLLFVGVVPWIMQLFKGIFRNLEIRLKLPVIGVNHQSMWLCLMWCIAILIFFSISNSKLPGYILPVIPALAMVMAISIDHSLNTLNSKGKVFPISWVLQVSIFLLIFLIGLTQLHLIEAIGEPYEVQSYAIYAKRIQLALYVGILACTLSLLLYKKLMTTIKVYAFGFLIITLIVGLSHESVGRLLSGVDVANQVKPFLKPDTKIYAIELLDHTLPFYLERPTIMVNYQDELAFGIEQEPEKWISSTEDWMQLWKNTLHEDAFAIMRSDRYQYFLEQGLPMQLVAQDALRTVVRKP